MSKDRKEVSLEPENWDEFRTLGHRMLDDQLDLLQNIRTQPYVPLTEEAKKVMQTPLPVKGDGAEKTYDFINKNLIPHRFLFNKPDFWGFVVGSGSPYGMLTDMVISGLHDGVVNHTFITNQAIDWIKELLEYPMEAGGVFVSGGSEANFTGIAVARNAKAKVDMKADGMQSVTKKMTLYCSKETHDCLDRSVELLGLGNKAMRWIPIDENHQMNIELLKKEIQKDRENGFHPFCIIGNAGTVHTGAFDDFNALADICEKEDMWFHVDGAFGAWIKLSEKYKHLADGMERADSIAVDLHKWMNMPYVIACTLVKDRLAHFSTFVYGHDAEYLKTLMGNMGDALTNPYNLSLALSRPEYGLKAYMLLRAFGRDKYCDLVQQNIDQIHYLAEIIRKESRIEITAPVVSNVVCFRYVPDGLNESDIEKFNRRLLGEFWKINIWMISDTTLDGKYMLRVCNVNNRSKYSDFDVLVENITSIGETLAKEYNNP